MWYLLKDLLLPKNLKEIDGDEMISKNYVFTLMNNNQRAIVRLVSMKEYVKDVLSEAKAKSFVIAVQALPQVDTFVTLNQPDTCILYCTMVNQYTYQVGEPFLLFVLKMDSKEEVREKILQRLMGLVIEYEYGRDPATKESIIHQVSYEQKNNFLMYYVDYKTSRRTVIYEEFNLRELQKDDPFLEYKNG